MNGAQRLWPTLQALGRPFIFSRSSEILQHGMRFYNSQNFSPVFHQETCLSPLCFNDDRLGISHCLARTSRGSYVKVLAKNFSHGSWVYAREFIDEENIHAHNVLLSLPEYSSTTVDASKINLTGHLSSSVTDYNDIANKDWPNSDIEEIVQTLSFITSLPDPCSSFDDMRYATVLCSLCEKVNELSDNQMIRVLRALTHLPHACSSSNFLVLKNKLNENCSLRIKKWSTSHVFLIADYWYALRMPPLSAYFAKLTSVLANRILSMSPSELVQFMFCVNLYRKIGPIKLNVLERRILEAFDAITIEESAIIAMGFFKTETALYNTKLIDAFIKKTIDNIEVISSPALSAILKLLRKSLPGTGDSKCLNFLNAIYPHLNRFTSMALLHVALLGSNLLVFHPDCINFISQRFGNEISTLRLKDLERFSYVLMLFRFIPPLCPNIFDLIMNELGKPERIVEINHFPKCFISCVNYIAAFGILPYDLISASLQPTMIEHLKETNMLHQVDRDLNELNWILKIEVPPTYPGYRLDPHLSKQLTEKFMGRVPRKNSSKLTHQENFTLDVSDKLSKLVGQEVPPVLILPHFPSPDLVFCTNLQGDPVPIPREYFKAPFNEVKLCLPHTNLIWNAIILGGRNSFIKFTTNLRGNFEMKRRQLNLLGYHVYVVPHQDYIKKSVKNKLNCLRDVLSPSGTKLKSNDSEMRFNAAHAYV